MQARDPKQEAAYRQEVREAEREIQRAGKPGRLKATPLLGTKVRRARWIWDGRIPQGELSLMSGREGTGKSTITFDLAASLSRGDLAGEHLGVPKAVLITASEDSFEHTITPRLLAAGADLSLVYRIDCVEGSSGVTLPTDLVSLEGLVHDTGAVMLILDPLISRLGELDTHRDSDVRQALEPLVEMAETTGLAVVGLIHHNKTGATDPTKVLMGSTAFAAVARSVLMAAYDPEDGSHNVRLLAHAKSSLGRHMPTLAYAITEEAVGDDEGPVLGSKIEWQGEDDRNAWQLLEGPALSTSEKKQSAAAWLFDYLDEHGPTLASTVKAKGRLELDVSPSTLDRAANEIGVVKTRNNEFQAAVTWTLP